MLTGSQCMVALQRTFFVLFWRHYYVDQELELMILAGEFNLRM